MATQQQLNFPMVYTDARLNALFDVLDELHSAASAGSVNKLTSLSNHELKSWLKDFVYTALETIDEIDSHSSDGPGLSLVK
jgi:hypothetical protein